jgi:hypothetical protein
MLKILYQNIFLPKILGKSLVQTCQKYIKKEKEKKKKRKKKKKEKDQDLHVLMLQYRTLFRDCFLADTTLFLGK